MLFLLLPFQNWGRDPSSVKTILYSQDSEQSCFFNTLIFLSSLVNLNNWNHAAVFLILKKVTKREFLYILIYLQLLPLVYFLSSANFFKKLSTHPIPNSWAIRFPLNHSNLASTSPRNWLISYWWPLDYQTNSHISAHIFSTSGPNSIQLTILYLKYSHYLGSMT